MTAAVGHLRVVLLTGTYGLVALGGVAFVSSVAAPGWTWVHHLAPLLIAGTIVCASLDILLAFQLQGRSSPPEARPLSYLLESVRGASRMTLGVHGAICFAGLALWIWFGLTGFTSAGFAPNGDNPLVSPRTLVMTRTAYDQLLTHDQLWGPLSVMLMLLALSGLALHESRHPTPGV